MKLKDEFLIHNAEKETVLVPVGGTAFSGLVRGNRTFGAILDLLKTQTTEDEIIAAMKERFDASEDTIKKDVEKVLSELRKIDAIDE